MSTMTEIAGVAIIADDEITGRVLCRSRSPKPGCSRWRMRNGTDALAGALSNDVAIVLLDVDMPGLNGYEVCRRLRAEARFATIPIVMVTGHEDSEAIRLAFEAGATDFVAKPVNWSLLPRRLEYILRNAAAAQALIVERGAHRTARLFRSVDRLAESAALHGKRGVDVRQGGALERVRCSHLYRSQQPEARQRFVWPCHGRRRAARVRRPAGADGGWLGRRSDAIDDLAPGR